MAGTCCRDALWDGRLRKSPLCTNARDISQPLDCALRPQGQASGGAPSRLLAWPICRLLAEAPVLRLEDISSPCWPVAQGQGVQAQRRSPPFPAACGSVSPSRMHL